MPDPCLILADRHFGLPSLIWELMPMLENSAGTVLFRVKSNLKVTRIRPLTDGSWLVRIPVIKPGPASRSRPFCCVKFAPKSTTKAQPSPWRRGDGPACPMKKSTPPASSWSFTPPAGRKSCFSASSKATSTDAVIC
ncbi:MAG: hypothetical protein ABIT37_01170 [Luteolibacter sp.]